jgi:hypothetical protein
MSDLAQPAATRNRWRIAAWTLALGLWLLPLIAKQFTAEMQWTAFDFVVWAIMLGLAAGLFDLATRASGNGAFRLGAAVAIGTGFFITWSNLAVGIIGNENNPLNQIFFGVLAIAVFGALFVRFDAARLVRVMQVTAVAQALTAVVALVADGSYIFVITAIFVAAWLFAAELFRRAAVACAVAR